jgi:hypothetical protein
MNLNKNKNIILIIAAIFLFTTLLDGLPYGFFTILRFVVCAATTYIAWVSYDHQKANWCWAFGIIAVLFNPFIPIHLNRDLWSIIDVVTGVFFIVSVFVLKL